MIGIDILSIMSAGDDPKRKAEKLVEDGKYLEEKKLWRCTRML